MVSGLPGGAPLGACVTLMPQHNSIAPQQTPSPHVVDLSDFNVTQDDDGETVVYYMPDTLYDGRLSVIVGALYITLALLVSHSSSNW